MNSKNKIGSYIMLAFALFFAFIWIYPIVLIFLNSFKSYDVMMETFLSFPESFSLENYKETFIELNFPLLIFNTLIYTVFTVIIVVFAASLAAFKLSRTKTKFSNLLFMFCLIPMMIPFQSYMISSTQLAKNLHLMGNRYGFIVISAGLCMPLALFIFHGFVKNIPIQLDECARLDGATGFTLFFKIIFPLMKPIITTVIVIDTISVWNDFLIQLLFVGGQKKYYNIQNALYSQFSSQFTDWEHALPGIIMSMIPMFIFFIFMQKHIVAGITAGAVKE